MTTLPVLHFVPGRIQAKRLQILHLSAAKHKYDVRKTYSKDVTHILTEFDTIEQVLRALELSALPNNTLVLSCQWLIDSVKQGSPIDDQLTLKQYIRRSEKPDDLSSKTNESEKKFNAKDFPSYVCQRKCVINYKNRRLVEALDVLVRHAEYRDEELQNDYTRALAFCKAISTLKSIPFEVNRPKDIENLTDIGPHSLRVISEILEDGRCAEVEQVTSSQWFKSMEAFNAVYGIGPVTAKKLYAMGMRTINDLRENKSLHVKGEDRIAFGLAFYEDLNTPVTFEQAQRMKAIITREATEVCQNINIELTGGFRRGKTTGHDIDFLFCHPDESGEVGFLTKLLSKLSDSRFILHNTYRPKTLEDKHDSKSTLDHFEQSLLILKLPISASGDDSCFQPHPTSFTYEALRKLAEEPIREWKAVRVDLVVCPASQHAYALLGWTGNKLFNRSLREYAKKKFNKRLTSHGLWDYTTQKHINVRSEKEIFEELKLKYLEPWERNA